MRGSLTYGGFRFEEPALSILIAVSRSRPFSISSASRFMALASPLASPLLPLSQTPCPPRRTVLAPEVRYLIDTHSTGRTPMSVLCTL